jgi:hypothetical protein
MSMVEEGKESGREARCKQTKRHVGSVTPSTDMGLIPTMMRPTNHENDPAYSLATAAKADPYPDNHSYMYLSMLSQS